jgi:pimeloyl-ACP methyl ester carboxylesterase
LHGLLGSKRNFASIGTSLSNQLSRKRRIFGVDLRNHGETCRHVDNWRDEMEYSDMAQDVLSFMNEQKLDKAVLVGHSMGGKVAQACALLEPERVDGLVVLDIAPVTYTTEDAHWKAVQDIIECMTKVNVGPGVTKQMVDQQLRQAIPDPALRAFVLTNLDVSGGGCQWKIHLHAIAKQLDRLAAFDIPSHHRYDGDVFFIHGGQSKFVRSSYMQSISDYFPNHLLTTIRGAGHWVHAEAPDDTTALLKRYLDR